MILSSVGAVLSIFLLIGVGVFIFWRKWIDRKGAAVFAKIVINIAIPANLIHSFLTNFDKSKVLESGIYIAAALIALVATYIISWGISFPLKIDKERRGVFSVVFAVSNSVFIGFPVAFALFGEAGMLYAVLYYMANTTVFWTLGYLGIRRDADYRSGAVQKRSFLSVLKKIINPPIISIAVGVVLMFTGVKLPEFLMSTLKYLSGLTTPLSLIFTGVVLADLGIKSLKFEADVLKVMVGRVLIAPAIMFVVTLLFGIKGLGQQVFIVQMGLPVMLQAVMLSEYYGGDAKFATKSFAWTTLFSLISIPCYMIIVSLFL